MKKKRYSLYSLARNNSGSPHNGTCPNNIESKHDQSVISIPHGYIGGIDPIAIPKHGSLCALSIEKPVISLYANGYEHLFIHILKQNPDLRVLLGSCLLIYTFWTAANIRQYRYLYDNSVIRKVCISAPSGAFIFLRTFVLHLWTV